MDLRMATIFSLTKAAKLGAIALMAAASSAWCFDPTLDERTLHTRQQLDAASLNMGQSMSGAQVGNLEPHQRLRMQQLELDQRMQQQQLMLQQHQQAQRAHRTFESQPASVRSAQGVAEQRRFDRERQHQLQHFEFERQYQLQQFRSHPGASLNQPLAPRPFSLR